MKRITIGEKNNRLFILKISKSSIKKYLISEVYPADILSVTPCDTRKQRKCDFKQILDKEIRYKLVELNIV